jgi:VCBS repeat-containing protein
MRRLVNNSASGLRNSSADYQAAFNSLKTALINYGIVNAAQFDRAIAALPANHLNYEDFRFTLVAAMENAPLWVDTNKKFGVEIDGAGYAVLGFGYDLYQNRNTLLADFISAGVVNPNDPADAAIISAIRNTRLTSIADGLALRTKLNGLGFEIEYDQARKLFNVAAEAPSREGRIDSLVASLGDSVERAVVLSAVYLTSIAVNNTDFTNDPRRRGALFAALRSGDYQEAFVILAFTDEVPGSQNQRALVQGIMFGALGSGETTLTLDSALGLAAALQKYRTDITANRGTMTASVQAKFDTLLTNTLTQVNTVLSANGVVIAGRTPNASTISDIASANNVPIGWMNALYSAVPAAFSPIYLPKANPVEITGVATEISTSGAGLATVVVPIGGKVYSFPVANSERPLLAGGGQIAAISMLDDTGQTVGSLVGNSKVTFTSTVIPAYVDANHNQVPAGVRLTGVMPDGSQFTYERVPDTFTTNGAGRNVKITYTDRTGRVINDTGSYFSISPNGAFDVVAQFDAGRYDIRDVDNLLAFTDFLTLPQFSNPTASLDSGALPSFRWLVDPDGAFTSHVVHHADGSTTVTAQFDYNNHEDGRVGGAKGSIRAEIPANSDQASLLEISRSDRNGTVTETRTQPGPGPTGWRTAKVELDFEAPPNALTAEKLGSGIGSTIGNILANGDPLKSIVYGAALSTVLGNLGEILDNFTRDFTPVDSGSILGSDHYTAAEKIDEALHNLPQDLLENLRAAGEGAISSFLVAEVIQGLGLEGTVVGDLGQSAGTAALTQVIHNIFSGAANPFVGVHIDPVTIIVTYIGGKLADAIWKPDTVGGQIGSAIGSTVGSIHAALIIASGGNPLVALAFLVGEKLLGGLIGSLFGGKPRSDANLVWNSATGQFAVGWVSSKNGGSKETAISFADSVAGMLNGVVAASAAKLIDPNSVRLGSYGTKGKDFLYTSAWGGEIFKTRDAETLINHGAYIALSDVASRLMGGDIYVKRSLSTTLRQANGYVGASYSSSGSFNAQTLLANITIAQDYSLYLDNSDQIDLVIASDRTSTAAAGWMITLQRARELGLNKRAATDWIGGWTAMTDEVLDGRLDGAGISIANLIPFYNADSNKRVLLALSASGEYLGEIEDTILSGEKTRITGSAASDIITVSNDVLISSAGLMINGAAPTASALTIPVAAKIDAGDGDDIVRAGDLGNDVLGGAGNDRIVGGKLDDWLFGEDGDDTLFAGDVVSAGVVSQAALQAGGVLVVDAVAASAVDGGNGDLLDGGAGNDRLYGGKGSDWLKGGDGVDMLFGGAGGDILEGGAGDDKQADGSAAILGGAGSDQYVFGYGDGVDVLFDESDPHGVAGANGDSFYNRLDQMSRGVLARNWAGGGDYEVDGSVKGGEDAIVFGVGVGMQNLVIKRSGANGQDLVIQLTADDPAGTTVNGQVVQLLTGDSLTIKDWFESTRKVEWLRFANGDEIRIGDITSYIVGVAGQSVIIGTNGADWIVGSDGADKIYGLRGDDFGFGGLGNDLVSGDANNDLVSGGSGDDIVIGGLGNDTVLGDGGADHLAGGVGLDILAGGKGDDVIVGGQGNDVIRYSRGDGADVVIDDLVNNWDRVWDNGVYVDGYRLGPNGTVVKDVTNLQGTTTVVYFDGSNWINGADYEYDADTHLLRRHKGAVNGVITGDVLLGGSDTLEFGVGIDIQDLLLRRVGNDLVITVSDVDATSGFAGNSDQITIKDWWSASTGQEQRPIEKFSFLATGATVLADFKVAGAVSDSMDIPGRSQSADWITGGGGDDTISGEGGDDLLSGGAGADTLNGGIGVDILYGGSGDDSLQGGDGADKLFGGAGTDIAYYKTGNFSNGRTVVRAYLDAAWANGGAAIGDTYDSIEGLEGGLLADRLGGDDGDNVIRGGGAMVDSGMLSDGIDRMFGGAGDDTYVYSNSGAAEIREGALQVEEIRDAAGALKAGFTATWQYMRYGAAQTGTYYQYQLTVRRDATGEVVYSSIDGADFLYLTPQGLPGTAAWASGAGQWKNGATASGNGWQVTVEKIVAGNGGNDDLAMDEAGIALSRLGFARSGADLDVLVDGVAKVKLVNQTTADSAVESVLLADGLSLDLTKLRLSDAEATAGEDVMIGGAAGDTLHGQAGDDIISGGGGVDWLYGGDGEDNLDGGAGVDHLDGGGDRVSANQEIDPTNPSAYGDTARYTGSSVGVAVDLFTGVASGGDAEGDEIVKFEGVSTIENLVGSLDGADTLSGDERANRLFGLGGDDVLNGRGGKDVLIGGAGNDTLYGGDGDDNLAGEDGVDRLEGGAGVDTVTGGAGADTLLGGAGKDHLMGDDGDDVLYGEADDDELSGGAGADLLYGGDGADTLVGGEGDDLLDGGAGDDTYSFDANSGFDQVIDASGTNRVAINGVTADRIWLTRAGNDLNIGVIGGSSVIVISGYYAATGAGVVKEIVAVDKSLFLAHAQGLIEAMTAFSGWAPATAPATVATLAATMWQSDRTPAPVLIGSSLAYNVDEDHPLAGWATAIDQDDNITNYAVAIDGSLGHVTIHPTTGAWIYTPLANANGVDTFVISVTDANNQTVSQTVSMTIQSVNDGPTLVGPSALTVSEATAAGGFVAAFSSIDPDVGDTNTFTLDNDAGGRFVISSTGQLSLKPGVSLNYETATSHVVRVRVRDGAGLYTTQDLAITVADANEAPTAINATGLTIAENKVADTVVATLTSVDPDVGDIVTFSLTNDAGGRFKIVGNKIYTTPTTLDYEAATSHVVTVLATDRGGLTFSRSLTVTVTNVNEKPTVIGTNDLAPILENSAVGTVVAHFWSTDPDAGDTRTFSLTNDAGGRFTISPAGELVVQAGAVLDYETLKSHTVTVKATDGGGLSLTKSFTVNILNAPEAPNAPAVLTSPNVLVNENASLGGLTVATFQLTDPDLTTPTLQLAADAQNWLEVVPGTGTVRFKAGLVLNFEALAAAGWTVLTVTGQPSEVVYTAQVQARDATALLSPKTDLVIRIKDVNEAPTGLTLTPTAGLTVHERDRIDTDDLNAAPAILLGTLNGTDPDLASTAFGTLTYSTADTRFWINGRDLWLNAGAMTSLDFEDSPTFSVVVTVTDGGGLSLAPQTLTFTLTNRDDFWRGGNANESYEGQSGRDQLFGNNGDDVLKGNAGSDDLWGGAGIDTLSGGIGNDLLKGEDGNDILSGDDGDDTLDGYTGADSLSGGAGADLLDGGDGDDLLIGGAGADRLTGGLGYDTLSYAGSTNGVSVNLATKAVSGGDAAGDVIVDAFEKLLGSDGNDVLVGSMAVETIDGGMGNDNITGGGGQDLLYGGTGDDKIYGDSDNDTIYGGDGDDELTGGAGADKLYGGAGNDKLYADGGGDLLDGGEGDDLLVGYIGSDDYIVSATSGNDRIVEYDPTGEDRDTINFVGLAHNQLWLQRVGDDLKITILDKNSSVTVAGWFTPPPPGSSANTQIEVLITDPKVTLQANTLLALMDAKRPGNSSSTLPLPGGFGPPSQSDMTGYLGDTVFASNWAGLWQINAAPTLNAIGLTETNEDVAKTVTIAVSDDFTASNKLGYTLTIYSDANRTQLVAVENVVKAWSVTGVLNAPTQTLSLTPKDNLSGTFYASLTVKDLTDKATTQNFQFNIAPVADAPTLLTIASASGTLDAGSMVLGDLPAALVDIDGSETLEVVITGLSAGLNLNKGARQADGTWKLMGAAQLTGLVLTGASTWAQDQTLSVTAYSREASPSTSVAASVTRTWTIVINARPTDLMSGAISVNETTAAGGVAIGTVLTTFTRADADGAADTPKYFLVAAGDGKALGADGRFSIDQTTGQLKLAANTGLNYEAATSHLIRVRVTDSGNPNLGYEENFTVAVTDVNEAPTVGALTGSLSEAAALGANLGTVSFSDPDTLTPANVNLLFALSGSGYEKFAISNAGVITYAAGSIDYETQPHAYNLTVTVTDRAGGMGALSGSNTVTINVADVNEAPTVGAFTGSITEMAAANAVVGTVSFSDPDIQTPANVNLRFALSGTGYEKFAISNAGQITYVAGSIDYETQPHAYNLTVTVRDQGGGGYSASNTVTINVADVNEAPTVGAFTGSISELAAVNTVVGTVSFSDPDIQTPANVNLRFSLSGTGYEKFAISNSGVITYAGGSIDYETQPHAYNLTVTVRDQGGAGLPASAAVTINIAGVNEPITSVWADRTLNFNENIAAGTGLAWFGAADPEGAAVAYSLINNDSGRFAVGSNGLLMVGGVALDYEAGATRSIQVRATDSGGLAYDQWFTVTLNNLPEAPTSIWADRTLNFNENMGAGAGLAWIVGADPENNIASFALLNDAGGRFTLDANGLLKAGGVAMDYEAATSYAILVQATDTTGLVSTPQWLTVTVNNANDAPIIYGPAGEIHVAETLSLAGPGQLVGTFTVKDQDAGQSWGVSLDDGGLNMFAATLTGARDGAGNLIGEIRLHGNLDFETRTSYAVTLNAWDSAGTYATPTAITVKVDNVNEAPVITPTIASYNNYNPGNGVTYIIYREARFVAADPEGNNALAFSIGSYSNYSGNLPPQITYGGVNTAVINVLKVGPQPSGPYSPPQYYANYTLNLQVNDAGLTFYYTYTVNPSSVTAAPIVLDLDGDGVTLTKLGETSTIFDQDNDGVADLTGWVGAGDGLLVLDRNANGVIDDNSEIQFLTDLPGAVSDLDGLRAYDSDGNGLFDGRDARFADFQIWRDANQDGVSQAGELHKLADLDITAIDLTLNLTGETAQPGENSVYSTSRFIRGDGTAGEVGDVMFAYQGAPKITLVSVTTVPPESAPTDPASPAQGLLPPVVIDLDGDGVELVSRAASAVRFDVLGEGTAVRTGWVGADDAFLALDRDGDGLITSGAELSFTGDLSGAVSDLEGLQAFDSNANGFLDAGDARFGAFRLWQDRNQDGVSQADELTGLDAAGVRALNLTLNLTGASLAATGENVLYATSDLIKTDGTRLAVGDVMLAFGDHPVVAGQDDGTVEDLGGDRFDPIARKYGSPELAPEAASERAAAAASSDGLDTVDRTAASTKTPKPSVTSIDGDDRATRPDVDPLPASTAGDLPEALAPRSWSQIDLSGILEAAVAPSSGLMAVDYDAMIAAPSPSAADDNLALAQQTRLRMIQAMAGFAREGAADLGPDAWRQGHAQSLALLTTLPDVRGR